MKFKAVIFDLDGVLVSTDEQHYQGWKALCDRLGIPFDREVNNRFRYRCTLVGHNDRATREALSCLLKEFANDRANRGLNIFVDCNTME